jgi:CheY-like chemotaxis protein
MSPSTPPYRLTVGAGGHLVVARFPGAHVALTDRVVASLAAALGCVPGGARCQRLILEIGNVKFVSGAALRALARLDRGLAAAGGALWFRDTDGGLYEFNVAGKLAGLCPVLTPPPVPAPRAIELPRPPGPLVVVADGDPAVREQLRHGLTRHGFAVWPAATGWAALARCRREPPVAAVLLGPALPGLDAPRTFAALRQLHPELPCGFLVGAGPYPEEMLRALRGTVVLRAPLDPADVAAALRRLLEAPA